MSFVANFVLFPAVQKFWTSVKIWQSYRQLKVGTFWDTIVQCKMRNFIRQFLVNIAAPRSVWRSVRVDAANNNRGSLYQVSYCCCSVYGTLGHMSLSLHIRWFMCSRKEVRVKGNQRRLLIYIIIIYCLHRTRLIEQHGVFGWSILILLTVPKAHS